MKEVGMLIMNKIQPLNRTIILAPSTKWEHSTLENVEWEIMGGTS